MPTGTVTVACPVESIAAVPAGTPLAVKLTVPVGVDAPLAATVAVTVVLPPLVAGVALTVVVVAVVTQDGEVKTLSSKVTAPLRAKALPATVVPVLRVTEVSAITVPANVVLVPNVADAPTCQNTLHAWALPMSTMLVLDAVVIEAPTWKMNTEFGLPCPSRVTAPLTPRLLLAL